MRAIRSIQKPLARLLLLSVCNLCCAAGLAQEVSLSSMSMAGRNFALPSAAPMTAAVAVLPPLGAAGRFSEARPRGVTGSIGQVSWKNLSPGMPIWHCRTGELIDRLEAQLPLPGRALRILPCEERLVLSAGKPRTFSASVADAAGQPLPGVPVVFASGQTGNSRLRVALSGRERVAPLTDQQGVATVSAAAVAQTTGHRKAAALAILAGIAAATIVLVVRAAAKEDPRLQPGTPSRVTP